MRALGAALLLAIASAPAAEALRPLLRRPAASPKTPASTFGIDTAAATVYYDRASGAFSVKNGTADAAAGVAWGTLADTQAVDGWLRLVVNARSLKP